MQQVTRWGFKIRRNTYVVSFFRGETKKEIITDENKINLIKLHSIPTFRIEMV